MSWQEKYHHNLDLGMQDSVAFDRAIEDDMAEQHQQKMEDERYEEYISREYEEYIERCLADEADRQQEESK